MRPSRIIGTIAAFSVLSSAWSQPPSLDDLASSFELDYPLERRQDNGGDTAPVSNGNSGGSGDSTNSAADNSGNSGDSTSTTDGPSETPTISAKPTRESGITGTTASKSSGATTGSLRGSTSPIPTNAYPGGVNFVSPNTQFASSQYYAMSNGVASTVTWVWNYTSLLRTPVALDIVATMASSAGGLNPSPFTLSANYSFEPTQTFKWDTGAYAKTSDMPDGIYTLLVYDADNPSGPTAIPQAGKLAPYNQFYFGVYSPQPYIEVSPSFICATCNAAGGKMERLTWSMLAGVVGTTVVTVAYITGANGIW